MGLTLRDLRLVAAIVDVGTLAGAATALHLTPSAVSRHLAELEARLRVTLFQRTNKRVELEPAGEVLVRHARVILGATCDVDRDAGSHPGDDCPCLHVGSPWPLPARALADLWEVLQVSSPVAPVVLVPRWVADTEEALLRGEIDLGVSTAPTCSARLGAHPLGAVEYVGVAASSHRWAKRDLLTGEDLDGEVLLAGTYADPAPPVLTAGSLGRQPRVIGSIEVMLELVARGAGVGVVPWWLAERRAGGTPLVARRFADGGAELDCWLAAGPGLESEGLMVTVGSLVRTALIPTKRATQRR